MSLFKTFLILALFWFLIPVVSYAEWTQGEEILPAPLPDLKLSFHVDRNQRGIEARLGRPMTKPERRLLRQALELSSKPQEKVPSRNRVAAVIEKEDNTQEGIEEAPWVEHSFVCFALTNRLVEGLGACVGTAGHIFISGSILNGSGLLNLNYSGPIGFLEDTYSGLRGSWGPANLGSFVGDRGGKVTVLGVSRKVFDPSLIGLNFKLHR